MKHVVVGILYKVVNSTKVYLFMSSTKDFGKFTGLLYPVGGHVEDGETETESLKREINEELGINVEPLRKLSQSPGDIPDQLTHWWVCPQLPEKVVLKLDNSEVKRILWLSEEEIIKSPNLLWPATYKFFTQVLFRSK
jgi:8-oxo-dGTP pyrophosphatase MutT (NUDIX family)